MAKKGEHEFDDFDILGEEALPDLNEGLPDLSEGQALADLGELDEAIAAPSSSEPVADEAEGETHEPAAVEDLEEEKHEKVTERRAGAQKLLDRLPANRELLIAVALPVLFVLLWLVGVMHLSTGVYLLAVAAIPVGLWKHRDTSSIYTVLLGCALAAILTAVYCLWREWGSYGFDRKAKALHPTASAAQRIDGATTTSLA